MWYASLDPHPGLGHGSLYSTTLLDAVFTHEVLDFLSKGMCEPELSHLLLVALAAVAANTFINRTL